MLAFVCVPAAGVKVAVRVRPEPETAPRVPPVTTTSPELPSQVKAAPGSSLKVKVMVAVSPLFNCAISLVMATVGAVASMTTAKPADAGPTLPAASVTLAVMVCAPPLRVEVAIDQAPPATMPEPSAVVPLVSYRVTVEPSSAAVPVKVGVRALVRLSTFDVPRSLALSSRGVDGASGTSVS